MPRFNKRKGHRNKPYTTDPLKRIIFHTFTDSDYECDTAMELVDKINNGGDLNVTQQFMSIIPWEMFIRMMAHEEILNLVKDTPITRGKVAPYITLTMEEFLAQHGPKLYRVKDEVEMVYWQITELMEMVEEYGVELESFVNLVSRNQARDELRKHVLLTLVLQPLLDENGINPGELIVRERDLRAHYEENEDDWDSKGPNFEKFLDENFELETPMKPKKKYTPPSKDYFDDEDDDELEIKAIIREEEEEDEYEDDKLHPDQDPLYGE